MIHHMKLGPHPFEMIKSGRKTFELRLNDAKRQSISIGDTIEFLNLQNKREKIRVRVTALHPFSAFDDLYAELPLMKCGYTEENIANASPTDMEQYYSKEEQAKYGVVAIEIERIKNWRDDTVTKTSRFISLILRHKPEVIGIRLDRNGWASVPELIQGVNKTHPLDMALLEEIVATDDKQRYSFNEDKSFIRANQGHSVQVDVELEEIEPPEYLWHGTATKYVDAIERDGLISKSRLYVHLSADKDTAIKVGSRHGAPVVYRVDSGQMYREGSFRFYLSANGVYLVKHVPPNYLSRERYVRNNTEVTPEAAMEPAPINAGPTSLPRRQV